MLFGNFVANALAVGFLATFVTSVVMILLRARGRMVLNQHLFFGKHIIKTISKKELNENKEAIFGWLAHILAGTIIGAVYSLLPIVHSISTGMLFSLMPWLIMVLLLFPFFGQGVMGNRLGRTVKWQTLGFHLLYGIFLGLFAML